MPQVNKADKPVVKTIAHALNSAEITQLEKWAGLDDKAKKANNSLVELLYANGRRASDLVGFGKDESDAHAIKFRDEICLHIIKGWEDNADALKYFKADPSTLSIKAKADQDFYKEQYRTTYYNLRKALVGFVKSSTKAGKSKPASADVQALRFINQAIKKLTEIKAGYAGIADDIKALKALNIKTKVIDPNPPK